MSRPRKRPHCCGLFADRGRCSFSAGAPRALLPASALTRLETRIRLADHEDLATAADHLAVAVAGLRRLQGGQDLHDNLGNEMDGGTTKPDILPAFSRAFKRLRSMARRAGYTFRCTKRFNVPGDPNGRRADPHDRRTVRLRQGHDQPPGRLAVGLALPRFRRSIPVRWPCGRMGGHRSLGCIGAGPEEPRILVNGVDATDDLRTETAGAAASAIAAIPEVRSALRDRQRAFRLPPGLVADGRDMGTVIFPDASHKVFLTASADERAERRYKQLKEKGVSVTLDGLLREILARDARDAQRAVAPLRPADDAVRIDTTGLGIEAVVERVLALLPARAG